MNYDELIKTAIEMTKRSYVPYSHFHVGAALLDKNGKVGQIENYGIDSDGADRKK